MLLERWILFSPFQSSNPKIDLKKLLLFNRPKWKKKEKKIVSKFWIIILILEYKLSNTWMSHFLLIPEYVYIFGLMRGKYLYTTKRKPFGIFSTSQKKKKKKKHTRLQNVSLLF